jgi:hypothetical protein
VHPSSSPGSVADTDLGIGTCPRCRSQEVRDVTRRRFSVRQRASLNRALQVVRVHGAGAAVGMMQAAPSRSMADAKFLASRHCRPSNSSGALHDV